MERDKKETRLRNNVEMAVEREQRQIEQIENRERLPGEKEKRREKWLESANRVDKSKLSEIWEPPQHKAISDSKRPEFGYFGGVNFDKNGKIIR